MSTGVKVHLMVCNNAVKAVAAAASIDPGLHYATVHMHAGPQWRVFAACCCCASLRLLLLLQHVSPAAAGLKAAASEICT
jgi:hypothetical protein